MHDALEFLRLLAIRYPTKENCHHGIYLDNAGVMRLVLMFQNRQDEEIILASEFTIGATPRELFAYVEDKLKAMDDMTEVAIG
jgi:hypothetical protein